MKFSDLLNRPTPQCFHMLALQGEDMNNQSAEILVECRDGKIYGTDDLGHEIKIVGESTINGWGEQLNGPAWIVAPASGPGKTYVPKIEWERILAGARTRQAAAALGRIKSPAKAAAARANGRKGGRPSKPPSLAEALAKVGATLTIKAI